MQRLVNAAVLGLCAVSFTASAYTVAWWHFDECDPGTTAPANTIACDEAPTTYAHVYTIGDNGAMSALHENSGDYLPKYAKPFRGLAVYDPVSDTTRTNHAAMKFTVARGGPSPDTDAGRARYGGGLKFEGGNRLYRSLYGMSALTVEAFVCTTGGVYNTFAPIVGCMGVDNNGTPKWTSEYWALYMENDGRIGLRLTAGGETKVWYSGSSAGGTAKVNDGAWHHVAFTYDGSNVRIYVDYVLDKKTSSTSDRIYEKTGNMPTYTANNATWIGGYAYGDATYGGRKFPGLIDEVRVSSDTLTPDQFLRMQPIDMDPDELVRVSFTPDEYGVMLKKDYIDIGDMLGPDKADLAVFRKVSSAGSSVCDTETKAGDIMAAKTETDIWVEDVASFYQETNDVGKANYVQMPYISKFIRNSDATMQSYTVEMFYKTRKTVRGSTDNRQVLMKFGGDNYFNVLFDAISSKMLYVSKTDGAAHYDTASEDADDGKWHHVAVVVDGTKGSFSFYFDYALAKTRTGTLPTIGSGSSFFFGAKERGEGQWFDGWMDDIRVTRRALTPDEFLTTHPVGTGNTSMIALFEQNYDITSPENSTLSVAGVGEARTGGNAPTFVKESRGNLILDGTNGSQVVANAYSVRLNASRVVLPDIPLFETDAYTVEFWAKFEGIVEANGSVAADSKTLTQHAPIMRLVPADSPDYGSAGYSSSNYEWFFFRQKSNEHGLQIAVNGSYGAWGVPSDKLVVDGKWHHYALTFEPKPDSATNSYVQCFYDYEPITKHTLNRLKKRVAGHRLVLGEGFNDNPNLVGKFDVVRVSKGVLTPDKFLGRVPRGSLIVIR